MRLPRLPLGAVVLASLSGGLRGADAPDFNRDIRPILSNHCFQCHGPDEETRKGGQDGLRLDTLEGARADLGGGAFAIVPGQPEKSELLARLVTTEEDEVMPPRKTGKTLAPAEIELLRRWIAAGAPYAKHWSYEPPRRPSVPPVRDAAWPRGDLDRFVLARLEREGLRPQPEADRVTLARRAALDLTGLPPALAEVEALVADRAPGAFERFVDRQLAKPAYGEHWGRMWLDLARYADSKGYADDQPRSIWAYRDYVIDAFNRDLPFDRFTIEQLAGDLLPNPTQAQLVATGFHRNTMNNTEGGTDDEEFRTVAVVDRVNTTLAVWMGTSMACAQCHTHKYDPITLKEYFQVYAVFNQTEDADRNDESPVLEFFTAEQQAQRAAWEGEVAALEGCFRAAALAPEHATAAAAGARDFPARLPWRALVPTAARAAGATPVQLVAGGVDIEIGPGPAKETYTLEVPLPPGEKFHALRLEAPPGGGAFAVARVRAAVQPAAAKPRPLKLVLAAAEPAQAGLDVTGLVSDTPRRPAAKARKTAAKQTWQGGAAGAKEPRTLVLVPERPVSLQPGEKLVLTVEQQVSAPRTAPATLRVGAVSDSRAPVHARLPAGVRALLRVPEPERTAAQRDRLTAFFVREVAPELAGDRQRLATLRQSLADMPRQTTPILRELPPEKRRRTHVQLRGNFQSLGEEVAPGVPAAWHPFPAGEPVNRLTVARWLVSPDNPLAARVLANRLWEGIFGLGLVRTTEEFGAQGELPSHPELLDWLATEVVAGGWELKRFLRLLVTSAAYRQSSQVTPEALAADPENRLLSRGPRVRLAAEMVRDQALAVSGLLSPQLGGPSVRPFQPAFDLRAAFGGALDWKTSAGGDRLRRGLYTEWRRSSPYPSMVTFDAPNREVCTLRRNRTNTPLQALVTLNDPVYVEAAQALGRLIADGSATPEEKARAGFRRVLLRPPRADEVAALVALYRDALAAYTREPELAVAFNTGPDQPPPATFPAPELAAWTAVANVLLNLDETLMKP